MAWPIILILEDERLVTTMLRRVLEAGSYEVLIAQNGTEALALGRLHQQEIAVLFCDIVLPDQAGPDVALRMAEICPGMRTLFTSGYSLDVLTERGLLTPEILQGETIFIQKPFRADEVLRLVASMLAAAEMEKAGAAYVSAAY